MQIVHRPYDLAGRDFEKMYRFLQEDYAHKQDGFIWLFSRLGDWRYGLWNEKKYIPTFFSHHAELWLDAFDQLLGFVISEDGDEIFFIFTRTGYEFLYETILAWTVEHWRPRYPSLKTEVHEYQEAVLRQLEQAGFHSCGEVACTRRYEVRVKAQEPANLPPGFSIVDMASHPDPHAKAVVMKNGFGGAGEPSEFDLQRYDYSRLSPAYNPAFDLSAVAPGGAHASSCMGFNDPAFHVAEIEKVCTHPQYRRLGLAEAVIRAAFQRLDQIGIQTAYITGYSERANGLYEKLGPSRRKRWFHYEYI